MLLLKLAAFAILSIFSPITTFGNIEHGLRSALCCDAAVQILCAEHVCSCSLC